MQSRGSNPQETPHKKNIFIRGELIRGELTPNPQETPHNDGGEETHVLFFISTDTELNKDLTTNKTSDSTLLTRLQIVPQ